MIICTKKWPSAEPVEVDTCTDPACMLPSTGSGNGNFNQVRNSYTEINLKPTLLPDMYFGFDKLSQRCLSLSKAIYTNKGFGGLPEKCWFQSNFGIVMSKKAVDLAFEGTIHC